MLPINNRETTKIIYQVNTQKKNSGSKSFQYVSVYIKIKSIIEWKLNIANMQHC